VAGLAALAAHGGVLADGGTQAAVVPLAPALPGPVETDAARITPASSADPAPPAEADVAPVALLVDMGSGRTLYARDADRSFLPASVTKTMTAFVAFEMLAKGNCAPTRPCAFPTRRGRNGTPRAAACFWRAPAPPRWTIC
jgi:D-alanyl-D-alanine carboxypeptidase (penicillin-binding protein 5/6)